MSLRVSFLYKSNRLASIEATINGLDLDAVLSDLDRKI